MKYIYYGAILLLLLCFISTKAQEKPLILPDSIRVLTLDEVVISGTRWQQKSGDLPMKVTSISPQTLTIQNPQTAADLLSVSGKVFIQKSQQGGGSPMIRGFATNRLLYTVDGVRMNTAIFRSGNIQNVISLDALAMDKAEVLFGAGSVMYGSDAIGGVMSFQTLTPVLSGNGKTLVKAAALSRYASANSEKTFHFDASAGWRKWAILSSITTSDFGDLRMGSKGPSEYLRPFYVQRQDSTDVVVTNEDPLVQKPSAYSQINMMQKIRFKPNDNWDFNYGFHYSETSSYARYDRHIRYKKGLPRYGEWSYGPQKWMMNNLNITHKAGCKAFDEVVLRLAHQQFEESRISREINKPDREIREEQVDAWSVNLDFEKQTTKKNLLLYGVEYVFNDVVSTGIDEDIATGVKSFGPSRYPQSTWSSMAVYVNDQYHFSDKVLIQLGLRYNQYVLDAEFDTTFYPFPFTTASLNKGSLTGSLGLVYRPAKNWVISANAATAFRSPNVDDLGKVFDSEAGYVTVPNPDLQAEYAWSGDFGIARIFGDRLKVDLSAYYTLLTDAMVRRDFRLNGLDSLVYDGELCRVQAMQNAAKATIYGIQAGMELKLSGGFEFLSDFNYQKGEEELDDGSLSPSRHAPPWFGVSRLNFTHKHLTLQMYAVYSGAKKFADMPEEEKGKPEIYALDPEGNPWSPGWYTLNFKAMVHLNDKMLISAGLENITDQRYRPYSSGIVAAGRNFILSFKFNM